MLQKYFEESKAMLYVVVMMVSPWISDCWNDVFHIAPVVSQTVMFSNKCA